MTSVKSTTWWLSILLAMASLTVSVIAQAQTPPPTLTLTLPADQRVRLGDSLRFTAIEPTATAILNELKATEPALALYLDGVRMPDLAVRRIDQNGGTLHFEFDLVRNAQNDTNRKAWDQLLKAQDDWDGTTWNMPVSAAISIGKTNSTLVDAGGFKLYVAPAWAIYTVLALALIILGLSLRRLATKSRMLLDETTGAYSLGKTQMAFWGLLVALTFFGVWILTGTMERISTQVLTLLGISAATGLGAVLIGRDDQQTRATKRQKAQELAVERDGLVARKTAGTLTPVEQLRLDAINTELKAIEASLAAGEPQGFWKDILNDGNGTSFHRLQVVIWTVVLGLVFIRAVLQTISMPEFPETLLMLMGISNGTYLGFKTAEK